jgi:hypothetical protein
MAMIAPVFGTILLDFFSVGKGGGISIAQKIAICHLFGEMQ